MLRYLSILVALVALPSYSQINRIPADARRTAAIPATDLTPPRTVSFSTQPNAPFNYPIAGDFNRDGKLDLAAVSGPNVQVALGNGDGTFGSVSSYPVTANTACDAGLVVAEDFNGDGKLDLAATVVCGNSSAGVSVLLGNGDGTFQASKMQAPLPYEYPNSMVAGDLNRDGRLDLVVYGQGEIAMLLGNGDGTFTAGSSILIEIEGLALADFNKDGKLDLITSTQSAVDVFLGNGDGTFQPPLASTTNTGYFSLAIADFNGDGILDLAGVFNSSLYVLLGKGDGTFGSPAFIPATNLQGNLVLAGDFNGDGKIDLASVVLSSEKLGASYSLGVLPGNGDGTFGAVQQTGLYSNAQIVLAGDFNGDGLLDLTGSGFISLQTTVSPAPLYTFYPPTLTGKTAAPKTVTVTNIGTTSLHVSQLGFTGFAAPDFAVSGNTCIGAAVPASGTCTVDVAFTPTAPGERIADLAITSDAIASPQFAGLIGSATPFRILPASLVFGSIPVGTTSGNMVIRVINTSSTKVKIHSIAITGRDKGDFYQYNTCGTSINSKATCSVIVQFVPTHKGARTAAISINQETFGVAGNPKPAPISGTGS